MKSIANYHPLLFIFLLVGYCQLFAFVPADQRVHPGASASAHYKGQSTKTVGFDFLFVEEERENEDDRFLKRLPEPTINFCLFSIYLYNDVITGTTILSIGKASAHPAALRSAYLVFRTFRI